MRVRKKFERASAAVLASAALVGFLLFGCGSFGRRCDFCDQLGIPGLIELPTPSSNSAMAIILTGDNGWRAVEDGLASQLRRDGIPVIGLLAPQYFAERRSANETASAVENILRLYSAEWARRRIILIGYSRGAGVLPFALTRMGPELRARVAAVALMGLEPHIDFKVPDEHAMPVAPEIEKLRGLTLLCVQGAEENDSLCPSLTPVLARRIVEPGGHHFSGDIPELARMIEAAAAASRDR